MEIKVSKLKEVMDLMKPVVPKKPTVKSVACLSMGNGKAVATDLGNNGYRQPAQSRKSRCCSPILL